MVVRPARAEEASQCVDLAETVVGGRRSGALVQTALDREQLLVALDDGQVIATLALFQAVEERSPGPRLFSSTEEVNAAAIQMHRAFGFVQSGYVENLPQGYRELLFYKRLSPLL